MSKRLFIIGAFLLGMLMCTTKGYAQDPSPVRLEYVAPINYHGGGLSFAYTDFYVHMDNLNGSLGYYAAGIRYEVGDGVWRDAAMAELGNYGTHRLFYLRLPITAARFAVYGSWSYAVSGFSWTDFYWDNNDGQDYRVSAWAGIGGTTAGDVGGEVGLSVASNYYTTTWVNYGRFWLPLNNQRVGGDIVVANTTFNKSVGIRMTTDGWRTFVDVPANFAYNMGAGANNVEVWRFNRSVATSSFFFLAEPRTVDFAVYYTNLDTGTTYWDNNFDQNYRVSDAAPTIR